MTREDPHGPTRLRVGVALTRALAVAVLVVVVYYVLPLTATVDLGTLVTLVLGLVALSALIGWQLRAIVRSPYPTLRAVETLAVVVPVFLVLFAGTYTLIAQAHPAAFTEPISRTDALYFTVTVFATVGFGDISAASTAARAVVTLQMIADLLLLGIVLRAILDAVQRGHGRLAAGRPESDRR